MNLFRPFRFVLFLVSATIVFVSLSRAQVGKPTPKIDIAEWISGEIQGENPFAGRSVVLEFWATWCTPCVEAIPHLNSLAEKYAGDKLVFVSISDEKGEVVEKFMANHPMRTKRWPSKPPTSSIPLMTLFDTKNTRPRMKSK